MRKRGLLIAAALAICAGGSLPARTATVQIVIDQVAFQKPDVKLKVGDTVEWINRDTIDHTATARNGDWSVVIPTGKKAELVIKKAGDVEYFCKYHPTMTAKLSVAK